MKIPKLSQLNLNRGGAMMRISFVLVLIFLLMPSVSFAATDVYYSVGTNASDLKNGSTTITISSGVATF
ncbi:MAG: hypothetical protein DRP06_04360, partial [Candidatus Aenigmatarchaeota archaeon]